MIGLVGSTVTAYSDRHSLAGQKSSDGELSSSHARTPHVPQVSTEGGALSMTSENGCDESACSRESGGRETQVAVYWCSNCKVPVIRESDSVDRETCPLCGERTRYLCADMRPVFPEERLLLEIILGQPFAFAGKSVWASGSRYYIDGKPKMLGTGFYRRKSANDIIEKIDQYRCSNSYKAFELIVRRFVEANSIRLNDISGEAALFIRDVSSKHPDESIAISFSGGKDSTVTADLVIRSLRQPRLVHVHGDTTLEFPQTAGYVDRYIADHPKAVFKIARNEDQRFRDVCEILGPPARMLRWCCSMFKTGPITRVLNGSFEDKVLTFYGIRKSESVSRSKYRRIESSPDSVKIQRQVVASPVFEWRDIEIWLYILAEGLDFNDAYRLGYDRVGCWCCPNNNQRAQFLSRIYMPQESEQWRSFLVDFARRIGKPDPEEYVDSGKWKARQGGNGLEAAEDVKIRYTGCTTEENARIYRLSRPMDEAFLNLFTPFGRLAPELGRKLIHEVIVVDPHTSMPVLSIQPFTQESYEWSVRVETKSNHEELQRMVGYQVRKFNACHKCLKCESICQFKAISVTKDGYHIDPNLCKHCRMCVTDRYLNGGCAMEKYLRTKSEAAL